MLKNSPKEEEVNLKPVPSKTVMLAISILFGFFGIDRLMLGYKKWYLKLLTLGGFYIWYLFDIVLIALDKMKAADGREIPKKKIDKK